MSFFGARVIGILSGSVPLIVHVPNGDQSHRIKKH
jgi:hypothetical protein